MKRLLATAAVAAALSLALAGLGSASTRQRVYCIGGGTKHACPTSMRLVCRTGGRTTLSRIVGSAFSNGAWRVSIGWWNGEGWSFPHPGGPTGAPVRQHRLGYATPAGARRAEALVNLPTVQVVIGARCRG